MNVDIQKDWNFVKSWRSWIVYKSVSKDSNHISDTQCQKIYVKQTASQQYDEKDHSQSYNKTEVIYSQLITTAHELMQCKTDLVTKHLISSSLFQ